MRVLVDTHCWLWQLGDPRQLGEQARAILAAPENEVFFSAGSAWEIVIKHGLGRPSLPEPPAEYIPSRLRALGNLSLPVLQEHDSGWRVPPFTTKIPSTGFSSRKPWSKGCI